MSAVLRVETPAGSRELDRADLEALAEPAAGARAGRWSAGMIAVPFRAVEQRVNASVSVTHVTFHAADGYAASMPLDQARADAVLLVPPPGTGRVGARLVVSSGETTCLNVKAVTRVELRSGPGRHTIDPNPHTPARVRGWDDAPGDSPAATRIP